MAAYTTADLLTSVRARTMLPDASSGSFSPANILMFATEELQGPIVSLILGAREKYYETYQDTAVVAGTAVYPVPSRAVGGLVSAVQLVANGRLTELPPIEPSAAVSTATGEPYAFYFQNNDIVLYPTPATATSTLRLRYYRRPSSLAQTADCAQVTAFDTVALTVTVSATPSSWTTGSVVDFVPTAVPYSPYATDVAVTGVAGTAISFATLPTGLAVGDWIALSETSPIPEIMREMFVVLSQATACKVLEASGAQEQLAGAQAKLQAYIGAAVKQIQPRDVSTPKRVVSQWRSF